MDSESALKAVIEFLVDGVPSSELPMADAIFIFGHIDPRVAEQAAEIYKLGKAPKIIISGKGRKEISGYESEAQFYAKILQNNGVPSDVIILEEKAMNSIENVFFGMKICHDKNFYPKKLILVAIPPLLRRSKATFKKQFPDIGVVGSPFKISFEEYKNYQKRLIAEFDRFEPYAAKGDIENIEIPRNVEKALSCLKEFLDDSQVGSSHFYSE